VTESLTFITIGVLVYLSVDWFGRLSSYQADKWQRDGVIRRGGLSRKVWREDEPEKFEARIEGMRFLAAYSRWFMRIFGAVFAIGGIAQLIGLQLK
jgi:hypothetical protein